MMTTLAFALVPAVLALPVTVLLPAPEEAAASGPARLVISTDGLVLEAEGEPPRRFASIEELARAVPGLRGEFAVEGPPAAPEAPPGPAPGKRGSAVRIEAGEIPALDLARFLADATGLPVIHDSNDSALAARRITVARTIDEATGEIVRQILEGNRIRVREERLDGRLVLRIESVGEDGGLVEPVPRPIVVPEPGGRETRAGRERAAGSGAAAARVAKGPDPGQVVHRGLTLAALPEILAAQLPEGEDRGVLVVSVDPEAAGGPAGLGALERFDVVTHVGETKVYSPEDLAVALSLAPPGGRMEVRFLRKGLTRILRIETRAR